MHDHLFRFTFQLAAKSVGRNFVGNNGKRRGPFDRTEGAEMERGYCRVESGEEFTESEQMERINFVNRLGFGRIGSNPQANKSKRQTFEGREN
jgi:hypothetical protein